LQYQKFGAFFKKKEKELVEFALEKESKRFPILSKTNQRIFTIKTQLL
jgi:hypothetical protein